MCGVCWHIFCIQLLSHSALLWNDPHGRASSTQECSTGRLQLMHRHYAQHSFNTASAMYNILTGTQTPFMQFNGLTEMPHKPQCPCQNLHTSDKIVISFNRSEMWADTIILLQKLSLYQYHNHDFLINVNPLTPSLPHGTC